MSLNRTTSFVILFAILVGLGFLNAASVWWLGAGLVAAMALSTEALVNNGTVLGGDEYFEEDQAD